MSAPAESPDPPASPRSLEAIRDYSQVAPMLPLEEESVVQMGRGEIIGGASVAASEDVALFSARILPRSVGVTVIKPSHIGFGFPVRWRGDYRFNGMDASPSAMYLPESGRYCRIVGEDRLTYGVLLPRDRFLTTLAALRGVDPGEVVLDYDAHDLPPELAAALHRRFAEILNPRRPGREPGGRVESPASTAAEIFGLITEAYLVARPDGKEQARRVCGPEHIVRRAEDRFAAAGGDKVSLADLCLAAGVSKSLLYTAFDRVCGCPPLAYFRKRRLMQARTALLRGAMGPGEVKRIALEAGFTEFGRFAGEYRALFGELPSVTLAETVG